MKSFELIPSEKYIENLNKLETILAEAIGTASMLWDKIPQGTFDSTKVLNLVKSTMLEFDSIFIDNLDIMKDVTQKNSALELIQDEHKIWCTKNFGDTSSSRFLMGAVEEAGELSEFTDHVKALTYFLGKLAHSQLKLEQKIRVNENHIENIKDAVSDIIIFLVGFCNTYNINIDKELKLTWSKIRARDWTQNKVNGEINCSLPINESTEDIESTIIDSHKISSNFVTIEQLEQDFLTNT